jgi:hypothetical protein
VRVKQPFFELDPIFLDASYKKRYEILCRRLILERLYDTACLSSLPPTQQPSPSGMGGCRARSSGSVQRSQ